MSALIVNYANPINLAFGPNQGLVTMYKALPAHIGAGVVRDLAARNNGTIPITNLPQWLGNQVRVAGVNRFASGHINLGTGAFPGMGTSTSPSFTISFYGFITGETTGLDRKIFEHHTGTYGNQISLYLNSTGKPVFLFNDNFVSAAIAVPSETKTHFVLTRSGATVAWYSNGVFQENITASAANITGDDTQTKKIFNMPGSATFLASTFDSFRVYNVALSAAQIMALYADERAGFPRSLNWIPQKWNLMSQASAAATFNAGWARGANTIIGGGVYA